MNTPNFMRVRSLPRSLLPVCSTRALSGQIDVVRVTLWRPLVLLYDLVGLQQPRLWDGDAERLRRLQVHHQSELGRLHYGEVGGLGALEDPTGIQSGMAIHVCR